MLVQVTVHKVFALDLTLFTKENLHVCLVTMISERIQLNHKIRSK